ncbi:MAG: hypothetical protein JNK37_21200 [Verrucomicrobiales bacterium]|nr:hypothetical protein [Verrucomicrobiales bacterium]
MWRALTEDDLFSAMHKAEIAAVRSKALADGQSDPVAEVIAQVTMMMREAIRSCRDNRLHPEAAYLPEAAMLHAVAIVRHRLGTRFGGLIKGGEDRLEEYRRANRYLDQVASCAQAVERYGAEESAAAPQPAPRITARRRHYGRDDQDGI